MAEEAITGQSPETATANEAPTDFREYVAYRLSGDLPVKPEAVTETPAAAVEEPPAKTAPDPEPEEKTQEPDEQDDEDQTAPKSKGGSRQRKIDRLTRENADLQRQLAAIRETPPAAGSPAPKTAASAPAEGEPKLEDFETLEAYNVALVRYVYAEIERERQAAEVKRQAHETEQKIQTEWKSRERAAAKLHDDYDDVIDNVKPPEGPGVMAARQAMLEDEAGPEILYYLGKHPDELERIAALSPVSAVREIGKIAAAVARPPAPENGKPKITGAPKPPPPSGRPSKTTTDDINDPAVVENYPRWERLRKAQLERR